MTSPPLPLEVRLLRKTEIRLGEPLKFPYAKVLALLAYLLLEMSRQNRALLTTLLWPEQALDIARTNLRNAVHALCELVGGYSGELMAGFTLPDVPEFMEWLDLKRLSSHRQVLAISERLFQQCDGDSARRLALAKPIVASLPIDKVEHSLHLDRPN